MTTFVRSRQKHITDENHLIAGKRRRRMQEALIGYLFVFPAALVTFVFGLWPVIAGFYESLKSGSPITNRYVGLYNYVRSLGSLTYILLFAVCLIFLYIGYRAWSSAYVYRQEYGGNLWYYVVPGLLVGAGFVVLAFNFVTGTESVSWLPGVLFLLAAGGFITAEHLSAPRPDWNLRELGLTWLNLLALAVLWIVLAWRLENATTKMLGWAALAGALLALIHALLNALRLSRANSTLAVRAAARGLLFLVLGLLIGWLNALLFAVLIELALLALPRLGRLQTGRYISASITMGTLLLISILLARYTIDQMEGDVENAQNIARMIFNEQVRDAQVQVTEENALLGGLAPESEITVEVRVDGKTIQAPLAPEQIEQLSTNWITRVQVAFGSRQRVKVVMPDGSIAEGELTAPIEVSLLADKPPIIRTIPIYSSLDVGENVILTGGYTEPLSRQIYAALGLFVSLAAIYTMTWVRQRLDDEDNPRAYRRLQWGRIALAVAAVLLFFYLLSSVQLNRQVAAGMRALSADQFDLAYEYVTGAKPPPILRPEALAAQLLYWPQVFLIAVGALLIGAAYLVWRSAQQRESKLGFALTIVLAVLLMVGGWLLIGELPRTMAMGGREAKDTFDALMRTAMYSVGTVPVQLALGLLLAYLLFSEVSWGKGLFRVIYFMPYIAPSVATSTVFLVIFSTNPRNLSNRTLSLLGIDPLLWLQEPKGIVRIFYEQILGGDPMHIPGALQGPSLALFTVILYNIWVFAGYNAVVFLAGLGAIPGELYEAAQVDGAGRWARFRNITLPLLSPTTFFLSMLSIIGTFKAFTHIYVLRRQAVGKEVDTMSVHIFNQLYQANDPGYAAALAFMLFGVILVLTLVQNRLAREQVFYG